ncbi:MAG: type II toxin-antitoxin system HicA family toxin [Candidatus Aenigmarchaeota archaeon]|nr:type II toxin-antitoxin system HicA family toxin [Candidatus Aenigmarchaeota archaeon]
MKIPIITSNKMIKIIKKKSFVLVRQSGSHMIFRNPEGVRTTIPRHSKKILHPKIVKSIIRDAELTEDDF